jgi:hypothetical protein
MCAAAIQQILIKTYINEAKVVKNLYQTHLTYSLHEATLVLRTADSTQGPKIHIRIRLVVCCWWSVVSAGGGGGVLCTLA